MRTYAVDSQKEFAPMSQSQPAAETAKSYKDTLNLPVTDFKMKAGADVVVLDVRTAEEFNAGRIPGAINLDVLKVEFLDKINSLDKNKTYLVYCRSGSRSINACAMLGSRGYRSFNLLGGIFHWNGVVEHA